jgi:hypothetical protein
MTEEQSEIHKFALSYFMCFQSLELVISEKESKGKENEKPEQFYARL